MGGIAALVKSLAESLFPLVKQLAGKGSISSQFLRYYLAVFGIFTLLAVVSMLVSTNEQRLVALPVLAIFTILAIWTGKLFFSQNYKLLIEVFDDANHMNRTPHANVAVRGIISDDKQTGSDGKTSWLYEANKANESVTITVRKDNRVSEAHTITLKPEPMYLPVVLPLQPEKVTGTPSDVPAPAPQPIQAAQAKIRPEPVDVQQPQIPVPAGAPDNLESLLETLQKLVENSTHVATPESRQALCDSIGAGAVNYVEEAKRTFSRTLVRDLKRREKYRSLVKLCDQLKEDYEGTALSQLEHIRQTFAEDVR